MTELPVSPECLDAECGQCTAVRCYCSCHVAEE